MKSTRVRTWTSRSPCAQQVRRHCNLVLDGKEVTFDASKVIDSNEDPKYRLELWNCYGATKDNCAFGTAKGDVIEELGFKEKMELTATFRSLFPEVSFE